MNDYSTARNQRICEALVRREIGHCVSSLVGHFVGNPDALNGSDYDYADLMEMCAKPQYTHEFVYECGCGHSWEIEDDEPQDLIELSDIEEGERQSNCRECGEIVEPSDVTETEADSIEALEHWIVSEWFTQKLAAKGEMIGELFGLTIWGRTCSGQAIHIDNVIGEIAEEMEILEGQTHEWNC